MSYDNLSSVSQNVLKFYQQFTGEERRIPFIFDDFHFCRSRVIGLDMTENRIFTLCHMITYILQCSFPPFYGSTFTESKVLRLVRTISYIIVLPTI